MGNLLRSVKTSLKGFTIQNRVQNNARIVMLGLDAAGKTTILYRLKLNETVDRPTIGFNVETVQPTKNVSFTVWDICGQDNVRPLWKHYFHGSEGLIYVMDSADRSRLSVAKDELAWILESDEMVGVPLVILANKQDLPNAASTSEIITKLELNSIRNRPWYIQSTCAVSGDGVYEAMNELSSMVKKFHKSKS
ncbi:uncharacterized protein [Dysidea avara]|uniref:uncharacterized protein n=1 Tax=Dysidea avara TaxID=196820 RepID=UPI003333DB7E